MGSYTHNHYDGLKREELNFFFRFLRRSLQSRDSYLSHLLAECVH